LAGMRERCGRFLAVGAGNRETWPNGHLSGGLV
jgi:hypothetical protein